MIVLAAAGDEHSFHSAVFCQLRDSQASHHEACQLRGESPHTGSGRCTLQPVIHHGHARMTQTFAWMSNGTQSVMFAMHDHVAKACNIRAYVRRVTSRSRCMVVIYQMADKTTVR